MDHLNPNEPHLIKRIGNAIAVHVPKSWDREAIEDHFNHPANEAYMAGDTRWKMAPDAPDGSKPFAPCGANPDAKHVILTINGNPFVMSPEERQQLREEDDDPRAEQEQLQRAIEAIKQMSKMIPRSEKPVITVDESKAGLDQLLEYKPEVGDVIKLFLQQVMRGSGQLSHVDREIIMFTTAYAFGSPWLAAVHRAAACTLLGGDLDKLREHSITERMRSIGAFAIAVAQGMTDDHTRKMVLQEGWTEEALHDCALVVGAMKLMTHYIDGLAASTPLDKDKKYEAIGRRLAEKGYL